MFILNALYEHVGTSRWLQDERRPNFLLGLLVVQNAPHAKGRGFTARSIGNARYSTGVRVNDAHLYLVRSRIFQRL